VFFQQRNYQAAANAYRESINGDGDPRWTEVWSHVQLGKIFDVTASVSARPTNTATPSKTNDNTEGAQDEGEEVFEAAIRKTEIDARQLSRS